MSFLARVVGCLLRSRAHPLEHDCGPAHDPDRAEATPDHEPVRPTFGLTEAAKLTGTSRSTIKRRLAAGDFPNATKDEDGTWRFSPGDLLAAGLKLRTPAADGRSRPDDEDQDDEAAELVAAEREKRAVTAERADAGGPTVPGSSPHPAAAGPSAGESAARLTADSVGGSDQRPPGFWRRLLGAQG